MVEEKLKFEVAPHIVEDLGLNLYTDLPRVLVEFVANSHDADATTVSISMSAEKIQEDRLAVKEKWQLRRAESEKNREEIKSLAIETLSPDLAIVVTDNGHGMDRLALKDKFLVAGRRRREVEKTSRSPGNRIVMGRKGLGKLAGFGVAHLVKVITKTAEMDKAICITLDYESLKKVGKGGVVVEEELVDAPELGKSGTKIHLSKLVYEPLKSKTDTLASQLSSYFNIVQAGEFQINLNGNLVKPEVRDFAYAYPRIDLPILDLIEKELISDEGEKFVFRYRIRFTKPGEHLAARLRGVRVYANQRLASAPDLLDLSTAIHGFRNTHYLDGIVEADFIDQDKFTDYIATDRQSLRWETSKLSVLKKFLTEQMSEAIVSYQKKRDADAAKEVDEDNYTSKLIDDLKLKGYKRRIAKKIASILTGGYESGVHSEEYKRDIKILFSGLGQGELLSSLNSLASKNRPDLKEVIHKISELTANEMDDFIKIVEGRISGLSALDKLVRDVDFKNHDNEDELHMLLKSSPWLIDPSFNVLITSNQSESTLHNLLTKNLGVEDYVPGSYNKKIDEEKEPLKKNTRPDLVFLLANSALDIVIIVELKAPNTPLHSDHLEQLTDYMRRTEDFLQSKGKSGVQVKGYLIGSLALAESRAEKVERLRYQIKNRSESARWKVLDILNMLEDSKLVHTEMWEANKAMEASIEQENSAD